MTRRFWNAEETRRSMADKLTLTLELRELVGKKVSRLRREGILPATVYGKGVGPFNVQIAAHSFQSVLRHAGRTRLIELSIPGQPPISAFIHALQRHPVKRVITHADFLAVDVRIAVTVEVPVHAIGESLLVKRGDAVLNQLHQTLDVHALPTELPSVIEVDVSVLDSLEKNITVQDIKLPEHIRITTPATEVVFSVTRPLDA